ncbi:MAG: hypothetical protein ACRD0Y_04160 [Terriglobales bacterium]
MRCDRFVVLSGLMLTAALLSGCALFHRAPPLPPVIIVEPPLLFPTPPPAPLPAPADLSPIIPPALSWKLALNIAPAPRPRPRRVAPPQAAAPEQKPDPNQPPPQLSAGLSQREQFAYRDQVQASLVRAQRDLKILAARSLSFSAAATRAQAGEYVQQAQQALKQGDLVRAQMLAAKAETLARFLLGQ